MQTLCQSFSYLFTRGYPQALVKICMQIVTHLQLEVQCYGPVRNESCWLVRKGNFRLPFLNNGSNYTTSNNNDTLIIFGVRTSFVFLRLLAQIQCCQLSRKISQFPESEISWIITKVCHFLWDSTFTTNKTSNILSSLS